MSDKVVQKLYEFIRAQPGGITLTITRMGQQVGVGYSVAMKALHQMEAAGLIKSRYIGEGVEQPQKSTTNEATENTGLKLVEGGK